MDQIHDRLRAQWIQRRDRFITQKQLRVLGSRPCDSDALLLSSGEVGGTVIRVFLQTNLPDQIQGFLLIRLAVDAEDAPESRHITEPSVKDILDNREGIDQVIVLKDHSDLSPLLTKPLSLHR